MDPDLKLEDLLEIPDPLGEDGPHPESADDDGNKSPLPRARTRDEAARDRWGALAFVLVVESCTLAGFRLRAVDPNLAVVGAVLPALAALTAGSVAYRSRGRELRLRALVGMALPVFCFVVSAFFTQSHIPFEWAREAHPTLVCFLLSIAFTVAPLAAFARALRHSFATASVGRGVALGIALGAIGAVTLRLHCPDDTFAHLVVGHGAALIFGGVVGAVLGRRVLRA